MNARAAAPERPAAAEAVRAGRTAQPAWAAMPVAARATIVGAWARGLAGEAEALVSHFAASGRPAVEVWSGEIVPALDALAWLAREGPSALRPRTLARSRRQWYLGRLHQELVWEPYGVVGVVTPANSWLFLALPQIAAALLAGNAVAWKPAPPGTAVARAAAVRGRAAGLPPGLLTVVEGGAPEARALVVAGVDKLHFTGSSAAGRELYRLQADAGRPAVLELSGRHVAVVLADADVEVAARGLAWGKLVNGGRNCVSVQLVLVEAPVAAALADALVHALDRRGGPPAIPAGPEGERLRALVADAELRGARRLTGAGAAAVVLDDAAPGMRVVDEEIQGPLLALATVDRVEQAVEWVNRSAGRLSASVWSRDVRRARRLAARLDVGQVWINEHLHPAAQPAAPLAGRGESGFGASRGLAGLMEMVRPKVVAEKPLRGRRPHYEPARPGTVALFGATVEWAFAPAGRDRLGAAFRLLAAVLRLARRAP